MLKFPNFTKLFEVHINVSDCAIRGVLMQDGHQIAFESKRPYGAQIEWPTHEKNVCHDVLPQNTTQGRIRPGSS
jgi:hypothetical protein